MTVPLLIVALILTFAWAVAASASSVEWMQHANDDADRAERATEFAEDCLAENRDLRDQLTSERDLTATYRRANCRLVAFIRDGYDEAEFAEVLAQIETTPLFDETCVSVAAREAATLDREWFDLASEEGTS